MENHGKRGIHGRKPFWHCLLFWLGLPGAFFLAWALRDSTTHATQFTRNTPVDFRGAYHWQGALTVFHAKFGPNDFIRFSLDDKSLNAETLPPGMPPLAIQPWMFRREFILGSVLEQGFDPRKGILRPSLRTESLASGSRWWIVIVPHWILLLGYLMAWGGAVAWWQRRKARLLKLHAASHE